MALNSKITSISPSSQSNGNAQPKTSPVVATIPRVFGAMTPEWTLKEVVRMLSVSRDSPFVREYLNNITPEIAAQKEGIDTQVLIETFEGKDMDCSLSVEGTDLIEALNVAITAAKDNPSQGLKRMWAALLAMKILQESVAAKSLSVRKTDNGELLINGFFYTRLIRPFVCQVIGLLYLFARTGKIEGTFKEVDHEGYSSDRRFVDLLNWAHSDGLEVVSRYVQNDKELPTVEKEALVRTFNEVIKFLPHLLVENSTFQQLQNADLKKWNDEFKIIAKGEPNQIVPKLRTHRVSLYKKTKEACERGYFVNNKLVKLDSVKKQEMILKTEICCPNELESTGPHAPTVYEVVDEDAINLTKKYQDANLKPVALNLANAFTPGGGVEKGAGAQEESIFRRSNYHQVLYSQRSGMKDPLYPIPENGVIHTPDVQIIRTRELDYTRPITDEALGYEFHLPYSISFIASAHVDLRRGTKKNEIRKLDRQLARNNSVETRAQIEAICNEIINELGINETYEKVSKDKMRAILRTAYLKQYDSLVLGALGCGAFLNPGKLNALYWSEVLKEKEFLGRFKKVGFAILPLGNKTLFNKFKKTIEDLN